MTFPVAAPSGQSFHSSSGITQNPDGLLQNLIQTFVVPRYCFLTPWWSSDLSCSAARRLTFMILSKMSRQPLDGFPWNLVQISMSSGWTVLKCSDPVTFLLVASKFWFVQYLGFWPNTHKTNDIPICLSFSLWLLLTHQTNILHVCI